MKRKKKINNILVHLFLSVLAIIWVSPLFWIILTSFRAQKGAYTSSFFPKKYTLNNYIKLFTDTGILNFPRMFGNTLFIAICSCIISTFFVLSVAYCMSRLRFRLRKPMMIFGMVLGLFLIVYFEYCGGTRTVSGIYGDDCGLLYFKSSWTFRRLHDSCGTDTGLLRFVRNPVLYCKRIF